MEARSLLDQLMKERSELDSLIEGLRKRLGGSQAHAKAHSAPKGKPKRHGRHWTPAMRAAMSRRLKQVIAAKRAKKAARKPKAAKTAKATAA
jgi:hypothetical protein